MPFLFRSFQCLFLCFAISAVPLAMAKTDASYSDIEYELDASAWSRIEVAAGVELFQRHFDELFGGPQFINVIRVNLDEPGVKVRFAAARLSGLRSGPLPKLAAPAGAVAAINGGFAHGGPDSTNSGIFKVDGEVQPFLEQEPVDLRFVGGAALGIDENENWRFKNRPGESWPPDWPGMPHALAGGHRLIEDGEIHPSVLTFNSAREERHSGRQHPRTAIGKLPDRTALLVTVDGRHPEKANGVTLLELAGFMKRLGCVEALNLDGGGSTTMWFRESGVINRPSDNEQFDADGARKIRSAVIVLVEGGDRTE